MMMHINERGECDLRTLVDQQRKCLVDVVVRLHGPTDQAPKLRHLRVLAHVQLDDDPRALIQQSVGEEFRQHDGVVTILMFYRRRASPKHRYNMTEVEYGGGGHRTRLRNDHEDQLVCLEVPPLPPYIKEGGGRCGRPPRGAPPPGVGLPPLALVEKERGEGKEERGAPPPLPCPIRTRGRGRAACPGRPSSSPLGPM